MDNSILIASPNETWSNETRLKLVDSGYPSECVSNGRDCQIRISKAKFFAIILDFEIKQYSVFEVLKFIKMAHPSIKILLLVSSKDDIDQASFNSSSWSKAGISEILYGTPTIEKVKKSLFSLRGLDTWKNIVPKENNQPEVIIQAKDSEFMKINIDEFYSGNITVFDHYIRLGPNNYKKILHRGENFDPDRFKKYISNGLKYLYLLVSERLSYINFINELVRNTLMKPGTPIKSKIIFPLRSMTIKYLEEVYTNGLRPELIEEGKASCQNMFEFIKKDDDICNTLEEILKCEPTAMDHSFLVSFFSIFICKQLNWAGKRTIDTIALGALLHDIGVISLPRKMRETKVKDLNESDMIVYHNHPKLGVDLLKRSPLINEQVLQIVLQHHEYIDGSGYPNQLTGLKIYPLAKIVSLANSFSELLLELKSPPKVVLKEFLKSRDALNRYEPILVKALVRGILGYE